MTILFKLLGLIIPAPVIMMLFVGKFYVRYEDPIMVIWGINVIAFILISYYRKRLRKNA